MPELVADALREEQKRLLEAALERPGVGAMYAVYEAWQQLERLSWSHSDALTQYQVLTSNACMPFYTG